MRRRARPVDLLPLLDVMMTVTFTFATIREVELGSESAEHAVARAALVGASQQAEAAEERAAAAVAAATTAERKATTAEQKATQAEQKAQRAEAERLTASAEREHAVDAAAHLKKKLQLANREAEALRERAAAAPDGERVDSVLSHLLKRSSVVEIELVGVPTVAGGVPENRCCFRRDPRRDTWEGCGVLPAQALSLDEWAGEGGETLLRVLEETKGGNAIAVVRQSSTATYRSAEKLERFVRERVPDRTVYREERGLDLPPRSCTASPLP